MAITPPSPQAGASASEGIDPATAWEPRVASQSPALQRRQGRHRGQPRGDPHAMSRARSLELFLVVAPLDSEQRHNSVPGAWIVGRRLLEEASIVLGFAVSSRHPRPGQQTSPRDRPSTPMRHVRTLSCNCRQPAHPVAQDEPATGRTDGCLRLRRGFRPLDVEEAIGEAAAASALPASAAPSNATELESVQHRNHPAGRRRA